MKPTGVFFNTIISSDRIWRRENWIIANAVAENFKVATLMTSAGDDMYMI